MKTEKRQPRTVSIDPTEAGALHLLKLPVERRYLRPGRGGVRYYGRRGDVLDLYSRQDATLLFAVARQGRGYRQIPITRTAAK